MTLEIKVLNLGLASTNCYIVGDSETGDCVMIDPVDEPERLLKTIADAGWTLRLILATHGHFDHVLASKRVQDVSGAPFLIHEADMFFLDTLSETGVRWTGTAFPEAGKPTRFLTSESETVGVGHIQFETLFTPGHAPGHIAFYWPDANLVFSGDALFKGSIGRTDLPFGDHPLLMQSIVDKLLPLSDDTQVLPGHGDVTTIGHERRTNPFILDFLES
jgi:glyoxylase-like metal-dependent hydrolase (beta-lactamase superfamily II)